MGSARVRGDRRHDRIPFVFDHTRGAQLVVMTLMLVLFMLNVPVLIAFTVARYEVTEPR